MVSLSSIHFSQTKTCIPSIFHPIFSQSLPLTLKPTRTSPVLQPLSIQCVNTLQPGKLAIDQIQSQSQKSNSLKIAIIGFGNFGQFLAKTFVNQGHTVLASSRFNHSETAQKIGVSFFSNMFDLCEQHPQIILLCTSILSTEEVVKSIPFHRLQKGTLFVDVLSVKEHPKLLLLEHLPIEFNILCTHPMFGPQTAAHSWDGFPFMFDKVRIGKDGYDRCEKFLEIFRIKGCKMVEMSCTEHDRHIAKSQFVAHTIGRLLKMYGLESTPINTKGFETLLNMVNYTTNNSFDLYCGLFYYNKNTRVELEKMEAAFDLLKKEVYGNILEFSRKQAYEKEKLEEVLEEKQPVQQKLLQFELETDLFRSTSPTLMK
ncbi:arogenate dehydrogenase [Quillaja saponaria]|uniref:Arogenate dehydrogenase n=1 Tax=Quillaja saponaria TaxID=32244 RepID=A0AAD7PEG4_QUISA|nr:arogenate dehydrogenase [Quillaja saponaria]